MSTQIGVHTEPNWTAEVGVHHGANGGKWISIQIGPLWESMSGINHQVEVTIFCQGADHLLRIVRALRAGLSEEVA
jgi:hypothetical protein